MCRTSGLSIRPSGPPIRPSGPTIHLLLVIIFSASASSHDTFRYQLLSSRRAESCRVCFGHECWPLEDTRCRYYAEADDALGRGEDGPGQVTQVDRLMADMVAQASATWMTQECIPLVSQYTNCNKENICVGCASCSCDVGGRWACKQQQRCRAASDLDIDHAVLQAVALALTNAKEGMRKKRAAIVNTAEKLTSARNVSYDEIIAWLFGIKPNIDVRNEDSDHDQMSTNKVTESTRNTENIQTDSDYVAFDEVLKNIEIDNQNFKRRKPNLKDISDYMDLEDISIVKSNGSDQFVNILKAIVEGNENTTPDTNFNEPTKMVIDLLASLTQDESNNLNISDYLDVSNNFITRESDTDDSNDSIKLDAINIMKRDVSSVRKSNSIIRTTTPKYSTTTKPVIGLKTNVLIPLTKIINDKQQELKDLSKIKEHLSMFIKDSNNKDTDIHLNLKNETQFNGINTVLSIYNLDMFPEIQFDLRKVDSHIMDKLLYKLKRDIYEVIRDIIGMKKISNTNDLPEDLKNLIRAMSIYVRKQGRETDINKNPIKLKEDKIQRRQFDNVDIGNLNTTQDYLVKILEIIDKNASQSEVLSSLSQNTRKIIKRVIENNYVDDFSVIGFNMYDPEYNLTNDLRNVGWHWQAMVGDLEASAPADKIYVMKLLHISFSSDISKLNNALAMIDYAQSRRMIPTDGLLGEELLEKIDHGLNSIYKKILILVKYQRKENIAKVNQLVKQSKKKSFLDKIKSILRGSKRDLVEPLNKKVPRSEIVKAINKKKLEELAQKKKFEYETTIRKWQKALNVVPRNKRSMNIKKIKKRMKNIIPEYLRGKLDPAISSKTSKKIKKEQIKAAKKRSPSEKISKANTKTLKTITQNSLNGNKTSTNIQ